MICTCRRPNCSLEMSKSNFFIYYGPIRRCGRVEKEEVNRTHHLWHCFHATNGTHQYIRLNVGMEPSVCSLSGQR